MSKQRGAKKDANHDIIIDALRTMCVGYIELYELGYGVPDLLVYVDGYHLWEIKNPETRYGKKGLNKNQQAWADGWRGGPVHVIRTVAEAVAFVNSRRRSSAVPNRELPKTTISSVEDALHHMNAMTEP